MSSVEHRPALIASHGRLLEGELLIASQPRGVVIFAQGSGARVDEQPIAEGVVRSGFAVLLLNLETADEESDERWSRRLRGDLELLATRFISARRWTSIDDSIGGLPIGYFGTGTAGAGALIAAAHEPNQISSIVCLDGRPDLAADILPEVAAPTLLLVTADNEPMLELNIEALARMRWEKQLHVVPREGPDAGLLAAEWFRRSMNAQEEGTVWPAE